MIEKNLFIYYWKPTLKEINYKKLIKIRWKIKISHLLQNRIFKPLIPFVNKNHYVLQNMLEVTWRNELFEKIPSRSTKKMFSHIVRNWPPISTPYSSKTVIDIENIRRHSTESSHWEESNKHLVACSTLIAINHVHT